MQQSAQMVCLALGGTKAIQLSLKQMTIIWEKVAGWQDIDVRIY